RVSEDELLRSPRQRNALRCVGAADAPRRRPSRGLPTAAWETDSIESGETLQPRENPSTCTTASTNACGASCGTLWPMPLRVTCEYLSVNLSRYALPSAFTPSKSLPIVTVGTPMTGLVCSLFSRSSYFVSPLARPSRQR